MQAQLQAGNDFNNAHRETMTAEQQARDDFITAHREAVAAQALAREDFAAGRTEEMAQRKRALDAQIALERLAQAGRVTEILITMARTARDETLNPPLSVAGSQRATFIPSLQAQLRSTGCVLRAGWSHLGNRRRPGGQGLQPDDTADRDAPASYKQPGRTEAPDRQRREAQADVTSPTKMQRSKRVR